MKVQRVDSPMAVKQVQTNTQAEAATRARAIAKMAPPQPSAPVQAPQAAVATADSAPVGNPNAIQPEEMGAITSATAPASEPATTEAPAATETPDPKLADRLAQLEKRERTIRFRQQQADQATKAKEEALAAREAAIKAKEDAFKATDMTQYIPKQRLKENPLDVLAETEISYDDLTNQLINQQPKNPRYEAQLQKQQALIEDLNNKLKGIQESQEQRQTTEYQNAIKQIEKDATKLVTTDPSFEITRNAGAIKDIVELIESTYKEEGELLTVQEAAEMVEKELEERQIKLIEKTQKLKSRFAPKAPASAPQAPVEQQKTQSQSQIQPMKTLTNSNSSTRQMTARERALLAFKGELKS